MPAQRPRRPRQCGWFRGVVAVADEIAPMTPGLDGKKGDVKTNRHDAKKYLLSKRKRWSGCGGGEIRKGQREHRQGNDHAKIGIRALQVVVLLHVTPAAEQQRAANHAAKDNHDDRE